MNQDIHLTDDWKDIDTVILYGAGVVYELCENLFKTFGIKVKYIVDKDEKKQNSLYYGIPVVGYDKIKDSIGKTKIVVMTAHTTYFEIAKILEDDGLKKGRDFCRIGQFICEWFWIAKKMNAIYRMDMAVTTKCTFNCRHCNMFIPYYQSCQNYTFEQLKENIDLFFSRIDYIGYFQLIGGEPFLNKELDKIIIYLEENYRKQYGKLSLTSNGSIIPSDNLLKAIEKYGVVLSISDYSNAISYKNKLEELKNKLEQYNINYKINSSLAWADFGFPISPMKFNEEELKKHIQSCRPDWNAVNDGKFYYCNVAWSAEKAGLFKLSSDDYILLKDINPKDKEQCRTIVELSQGSSSFCKVCGGCGSDNSNYVEVGVQK